MLHTNKISEKFINGYWIQIYYLFSFITLTAKIKAELKLLIEP